MINCSRPLDESDVEALAAGLPGSRSDAAAHAASCAACGRAVAEARALDEILADVGEAGPAPAGLADRVLRLRPFSRRERTSLAVWSAPLLLLGSLSVSGIGLVAGSLTGGLADGAGFGAAAAAALAGVPRALVRWAAEIAVTGPSGLAALAQLLRSTAAGWSALILLVPAAFGLRRVLAPRTARR